MKKDEFLKIRTEQVGSKAKCAELLGMSLRAVQRYESGDSEIPRPVAMLMSLVNDEPEMVDRIIMLSKLD